MAVVEVDVDDGIALVTLNRPEVHNALSPESLVRLDEAWRHVDHDPAVRVAVITGAGDRAFCSGADLAQTIPLMSGAREPADDFDRTVHGDPAVSDRAILRSPATDKPVIAAVNGDAIAGGMEIVLGTDLRVSSEDARFGLQEVRWGLFPMGGSSVRVPLQVPHAIAMEILLTGQLFDAYRAYDLGFVNRVVPPSDVIAHALELATTIAANGPIAVQAIKRSVRACRGLPEVEAMAAETSHALPVFASEDAREGPRAFLERRPPRFQGR